MSMPTDAEIEAEIEALRGLRNKIQDETKFGDSNRAAIDAQILALSMRMDEDDCFTEWPEDGENRIRDNARDAVEWMEGNAEQTPSAEWKPLIKE